MSMIQPATARISEREAFDERNGGFNNGSLWDRPHRSVTTRPRMWLRNLRRLFKTFGLITMVGVSANVAVLPAQATTHSRGNVTLFVHGFGPGGFNTTWSNGQLTAIDVTNAVDCTNYWQTLPSYLRQQGFTGEFIKLSWYNNSTGCDDNLHKYGNYTISEEARSWIDAGAALANYIYTNFTSKGIPVDVVAHSMGGVVTRSAVWGASGQAQSYLDANVAAPTWPPPIDVGTVITAGTPHNGSNTIVVNLCAAAVQNQQICRETQPPGSSSSPFSSSSYGKSVAWLNDYDSNLNTMNAAALNPQGIHGTQWINIGSFHTSDIGHSVYLPEDVLPNSDPSMVYSDGVIDTNSATSMSIPSNNKLILPGDVNHLEQFSQDALQKLVASALRHDNNWYAQNGGHAGWVLYNEALNPTTTTYSPSDSPPSKRVTAIWSFMNTTAFIDRFGHALAPSVPMPIPPCRMMEIL